MLVEIDMGAPIEAMRIAGEHRPDGKPNDFTNLAAIARLLLTQTHAGALSTSQADAISYYALSSSSYKASLSDSEFSKSVAE
jgi:hypothetical protein